jgi:hypothetical protein
LLGNEQRGIGKNDAAIHEVPKESNPIHIDEGHPSQVEDQLSVSGQRLLTHSAELLDPTAFDFALDTESNGLARRLNDRNTHHLQLSPRSTVM